MVNKVLLVKDVLRKLDGKIIMKQISSIILTGLLAFCLVLHGCGGSPYTYGPENELKPGPGLFSGKDGEFTVIGGSKDTKEHKEESEKQQETTP